MDASGSAGLVTDGFTVCEPEKPPVFEAFGCSRVGELAGVLVGVFVGVVLDGVVLDSFSITIKAFQV